MTNKQQDNPIHTEETDLQGQQIAGLLNEHAERLSMRTLKQLENSRALALKAHAQQLSGASINQDGTLNGLFTWAEQHRMVTMGLLFAAVIASFVVVQSLQNKETSDAFLLSADLPLEAFVDRGFEPVLNHQHAKL